MKSENNIPKFDLAEQILSGQRRFNAAKRIAPKKRETRLKTPEIRPQTVNNSPQGTDMKFSENLNSNILSLMSDSFNNKIISEIVARDIQNLRKR